MFTSVELLYSNSFPRVFVLGSNVVQFSRSAAEVSLSQDLYCTTFPMRCQYISQIFFAISALFRPPGPLSETACLFYHMPSLLSSNFLISFPFYPHLFLYISFTFPLIILYFPILALFSLKHRKKDGIKPSFFRPSYSCCGSSNTSSIS